jgi:hypothetical protein
MPRLVPMPATLRQPNQSTGNLSIVLSCNTTCPSLVPVAQLQHRATTRVAPTPLPARRCAAILPAVGAALVAARFGCRLWATTRVAPTPLPAQRLPTPLPAQRRAAVLPGCRGDPCGRPVRSHKAGRTAWHTPDSEKCFSTIEIRSSPDDGGGCEGTSPFQTRREAPTPALHHTRCGRVRWGRPLPDRGRVYPTCRLRHLRKNRNRQQPMSMAGTGKETGVISPERRSR